MYHHCRNLKVMTSFSFTMHVFQKQSGMDPGDQGNQSPGSPPETSSSWVTGNELQWATTNTCSNLWQLLRRECLHVYMCTLRTRVLQMSIWVHWVHLGWCNVCTLSCLGWWLFWTNQKWERWHNVWNECASQSGVRVMTSCLDWVTCLIQATYSYAHPLLYLL